LNQFCDFCDRNCVVGGGFEDPAVDTMLGEVGRLLLFVSGLSFEARGIVSDVRELLKDERRLFKLSSFRTREGLRCVVGEDVCALDAGEMGVRKLSARSRVSDSSGASFLFSVSASAGGGTYCADLLSGVAGCDVNGPPPGVGGSTGDGGLGDSVGGGMSVPSVKEYSTGVTERKFK
jgi:hypothetical protein